MMRYLLLAAALAVALGGSVMAAGVDSSGNGRQPVADGIRLAMGPTSAAHLPGGPINQSGGTASNCSSDQCAASSKNAKYRHKPSSQN